MARVTLKSAIRVCGLTPAAVEVLLSRGNLRQDESGVWSWRDESAFADDLADFTYNGRLLPPEMWPEGGCAGPQSCGSPVLTQVQNWTFSPEKRGFWPLAKGVGPRKDKRLAGVEPREPRSVSDRRGANLPAADRHQSRSSTDDE
jgi:hypothetical protein